MAQADDNLYGSGLNRADWYALAALVVPHYAFRDGELIPPAEIAPAQLPPRLAGHPVAELVRRYRATGNRDLLDQAGHLLVPDCENWWLVLTKA
jgi:hypothetical protein